jgi:hypothetical protein
MYALGLLDGKKVRLMASWWTECGSQVAVYLMSSLLVELTVILIIVVWLQKFGRDFGN